MHKWGTRNGAKRTVVSHASRHSSGKRCCMKESIKIKKKVVIEGQITKKMFALLITRSNVVSC